jgi:hypothetical protein
MFELVMGSTVQHHYYRMTPVFVIYYILRGYRPRQRRLLSESLSRSALARHGSFTCALERRVFEHFRKARRQWKDSARCEVSRSEGTSSSQRRWEAAASLASRSFEKIFANAPGRCLFCKMPCFLRTIWLRDDFFKTFVSCEFGNYSARFPLVRAL